MENLNTITDGKKEINYLSKDFDSFKENLVNYIKTYYSKTYKDFSENSTGMMFVDLVSYVGDVLSYYIDNQFKESLLSFAEEKRTVYNMAQSLGYKPKLATPSTTDLDVFQTVPAISSGTGASYSVKPDLRYSMVIQSGMEVSSDSGINFVSQEDCNFKFSSS